MTITSLLDPNFPHHGASVGPPDEVGTFPDAASHLATVFLEETIAGPDTVVITQYVDLLMADTHSAQSSVFGYTSAPLLGVGTVRSYERWLRVRFEPPFNTVRGFRFWLPSFTPPTGWVVNFGSTASFAVPVSTASSIATVPVPTSDPGVGSPNCGGASRLLGTGTQYSDWIVLQAVADMTVVGPGPVLGFSVEGALVPINFSFNWTEN